MARHEQDALSVDDITLPYRTGEFQEVAARLEKVAASLVRYPRLGFVGHELLSAAVALSRAEELLSSPSPEAGKPAIAEEETSLDLAVQAVAEVPSGEKSKPEIGSRGEWTGNVGRQPEYDRVKDGRIRAVFFLAQHPDPEDRQKTDWLRCYSLGRHAEALQKKGRLAGAEVLVRGTLQGVRAVPRRDGTTVEQQTVYCYGVRVVRGSKDGPGQKH